MNSLRVRSLSAETIGRQVIELHALNQIGPVRHSVTLDLALHDPPEPIAGAVFAQAMLRVRDDVNFVVHLPEDATMISSLIRTGVASALVRRRGCISFEPPTNPIAEKELWLNWTPAAREMVPMFGVEESGRGLFGPDHALFVNPHLTTEPEGPASVTRLVERWLTQIVGADFDPAHVRQATTVPVFTIDQLVRNVSEHAITAAHPTIDSMVSLEIVLGEAGRHLRVTVLDTGAGVVGTLRPKLSTNYDLPTDEVVLSELLAGGLPGWGRGRGFGLSAIAGKVLERPHSSLELWTGATRVRVDDAVEAGPAGAEIAGTVLSVLFPLSAS